MQIWSKDNSLKPRTSKHEQNLWKRQQLNNNALITETDVRLLPQMAKPHKADKSYSADESPLKGKKRLLKLKLK